MLNSTGCGEIQGFRLDGNGTLRRIPESGRALGLDAPAIPQFVSTPGDIAFSPDGSRLLVTTKAGSNAIDAVASFQLNGDGTLTPLSSVATDGLATCWLASDGPLLFAGNAGSATESSVPSSDSGTLTLAATSGTDPGTVDAAVSPTGQYLYVQAGFDGQVDEFSVGSGGSLTALGSVTVPNAAAGEGIATS